MFKRVTLVRKLPHLTSGQFEQAWLGEHIEYAKRLPGLREYVIDLVTLGPPGSPDGIATVRFDTREACDAAFATPGLREDLPRTRNEFADSVDVLFVDERVIAQDRSQGRGVQ